ncbi:unnamed protein product [Adineta steineri]|uniref:C2H2-type domain-containing protein n=1 Tax=Adineta steineri TaxID=433720 RepID=A0A818RKX5_9BILA|nr:unnamed protein product [Adineta steineri]
MANVSSLCNDIEQFLQQCDKNSKNQFFNWIKYRLNISNCSLPANVEKSMINTSQLFFCQCGHRYSFQFKITDESQEQYKTNSSRYFLCTKCQIHLYTRETFLNHYSMHQQGYLFCKRCFQFYSNEQIKTHDCQQRKINELQSLEQLIPPDITEQQQDFNPKDYVNDHDSTSTTRMTYFGLPKLTDSIIEIKNTDGKRLFRCPLCFNFYVNRSGLNRHYITHSSQDLWKVECQYCGRRYSRKDSLKYHMKKEHGDMILSDWTGKDTNNSFYHPSNLLDVDSISSSSNEKEHIETDDIVLVT